MVSRTQNLLQIHIVKLYINLNFSLKIIFKKLDTKMINLI